MLYLYQGNRLETLAERLAAVVGEPLPNSFSPEYIIVQSGGMARWISLELAQRLGVASNIQAPFPAGWLERLANSLLPDPPPQASIEVTALRIAGMLADARQLRRFPPLAAYLAAGAAGDATLKRLHLARRIAVLFDQYAVYREKWTQAWAQGEEEIGGGEHWQARLWRDLLAEGDALVQRSGRLTELKTILGQAQLSPGLQAKLPPRLCIFGLSALPPLHLEVFTQLARHTDVHLFALNPCGEYWGDIIPEAAAQGAEERYLAVGHPLLASLGRQARDFLDMLNEVENTTAEDFAAPEGDSILASLQRDIFELAMPDGNRVAPAAEDASVAIHACHSPMREVEVLHDQLLHLFETMPGLLPSDVLVMAPDIEAYAPAIEAVFGSKEAAGEVSHFIPYGLAERHFETESGIATALFALLDIGRLTRPAVFELLAHPAIAARFNLDAGEIELLDRWTQDAGIRWGRDAAARVTLGFAADAAHTWAAGFERLYAGMAMMGDGHELYAGIAPYADIEGGRAQALGKLAAFIDALDAFARTLNARRSLAEWCDVLGGVLERFFDSGWRAGESSAEYDHEAAEHEMQMLRATLLALQERAQAAGYTERVAVVVIVDCLRNDLETLPAGGRFLSGLVTFSHFLPMRAIPHRVVCLLGMNDGAFPRTQPVLGFDLIARYPLRGDRSRRNDDRWLFLETLLSAREKFYVSYVGASVRTGEKLPPSVLVSELLDVIARMYGDKGKSGAAVAEKLVVRHPLQPFSRRYFERDAGLFTYSTLYQGAQVVVDMAADDKLFALPPDAAYADEIPLEVLSRFYSDPLAFLIGQRLGVKLPREEESAEDAEPFVLDSLERWQLGELVFDAEMNAADSAGLARATGLLPHGLSGELAIAGRQKRIGPLLRNVRAATVALPPVAFAIDCTDRRITGSLHNLTSDGLVGWRVGKLRGKDALDAWLRHLVLNAVKPAGVALRTRWIFEDKTISFEPVAETGVQALLADLIAVFDEGQCAPLPYFPEASWEAGGALAKGADWHYAARKAWETESGRPHLLLACNEFWKNTDPLDARFAALAGRILDPLMAAIHSEVTE